jgi:hypothetical protein
LRGRAPFIEYDVTGLKKATGRAVDEAICLAVSGMAQNMHTNDLALGSKFTTLCVRDVYERAGAKDVEPGDVWLIAAPGFLWGDIPKGLGELTL